MIAFGVLKWRGGKKVKEKKVRMKRKRTPLKIANMRKSLGCRNASTARNVCIPTPRLRNIAVGVPGMCGEQ